MAPIELSLVSRQSTNCDQIDRYANCYTYSPWDRWGRWVALVVIVFFVIVIAFAISCTNARRRRRRGMAPRYGTGWLGGNNGNTGNGPQYHKKFQQPGYQNPAPPYSPPQNQQYTGNTFNSNEGNYGQQSGVELQQPQSAYQPNGGGESVYEAPQCPPPGKAGYGNDAL